MELLSIHEFEQRVDAFDAVVHASPDIDHFCSSSDWILPARAAWAADFDTRVWRDSSGYAAFLRYHDIEGARVLLSFDTMWGFSCPLVGREPVALADAFAATCERRVEDWNVLLASGMQAGSTLYDRIVERFGDRHELRRGPPLRRWIASLEGGVDGYLARRSAKSRANVRRARRAVADAGLAMEPYADDDVDALFARILDVELRSWKGPARTGLLLRDLRAFYQRMAERLAARGRLRALFARRDGEDAAYILGGVDGSTYRGFQFSFDQRFRGLSLGNAVQLAQIEALCDEGMKTYDLGIDLEYKRRWADESIDTVTLAVIRR